MRAQYIKKYRELGSKMFSGCHCPTVFDLASDSDKLKVIANKTGNYDDIKESLKRKDSLYTNEQSEKYMQSVIAANVTDIRESGYLYKKLMSSSDDMRIVNGDCGSTGMVLFNVDENTFKYKVRNRYVEEIKDIAREYNDIKGLSSIHVRTFTTCRLDENHHRHFCSKCAGEFRQNDEDTFVPQYIGLFSTLMITEKSTQSSLDSMNKGTTEKVAKLLETKMIASTYEHAVKEINQLIDRIGWNGVESRFYEIALLSRWYSKIVPLATSMLKQEDKFGSFIYRPSRNSIKDLFDNEGMSIKTAVGFDLWEEL